MTGKQAKKKLELVSKICLFGSGLFETLAKVQSSEKGLMLKEDFMERLYDVSLKELAHLLHNPDPKSDGPFLPNDCLDILR